MQEQRECLIIDDDQDDQEIFLMCLRKVNENIRCRPMNNGVEAIALLESDGSYTPDYIFIDVNMPKMNGLECLRTLKNMTRLQNTDFFMYSTTSETSVFMESIRLGAKDFIIKPAKTTELKDKLASIFNIVNRIKS